MGRTGKWFGYNHFNLKPDIVVLGKSLGNGYPISAIIIENEIIEKVEKTDFGYYQSHQNDPLGCKVAEAVLDCLNEDNLIEQSRLIGQELLTTLQHDLKDVSVVTDIRGIGLMIGIELAKETLVGKIFDELVRRGIIIGISFTHNMLNILPPYIMDKNLIPKISQEIKQSILSTAKVIN